MTPTPDALPDDVAALRIAVFRDWPYLYDGTVEYERSYLESYRNSPAAVLVPVLVPAILQFYSMG